MISEADGEVPSPQNNHSQSKDDRNYSTQDTRPRHKMNFSQQMAGQSIIRFWM